MKEMLDHALRQVRKNVTKKMMLMEKLSRNPEVITNETVSIAMTKGKGRFKETLAKRPKGDPGKRIFNKCCDKHGKVNMIVKINEVNHACKFKPYWNAL